MPAPSLLEALRDHLLGALEALGTALLRHPGGAARGDPDAFHRGLLRLAYRLILFGEEPPELALAGAEARAALRAIARVDAEDLDRVHESLLELRPEIREEGRTFALAAAPGHARRSAGAYYTPPPLVEKLLDAALDPALAEAERAPSPEEAILALRICDPACGSGRFLRAAARRTARRLALARHAEPSAEDEQRALAEVVTTCLHGVDLDPIAVELCRISLWREAGNPGPPLTFLEDRVVQGHALLGATRERLAAGIPDQAFDADEGEDRAVSRRLKRRNRVARGAALQAGGAPESAFLADAWCAAFFWPREEGALEEAAPTEDRLRRFGADPASAPSRMREEVARLRRKHGFFHWHLAFPRVFSGRTGGFDVVLGNPPWIAHAGRAAQALPPAVKRFYRLNAPAFAGYPTTHGVFVHLGASLLRPGGRLGFVIPTSLSELGAYEPTRAAHDALCAFPADLEDFGEGQFSGVTQPCMALVSQRVPGGRTDAPAGSPWPMIRADLDDAARALLARVEALPTLPAHLFGERGFQSDRALAAHFRACDAPDDRFTVPLREGTDVREFQLLPPRHFADAEALGARLRDPQAYRAVGLVIRQTARFPIAAASDGLAFRNSLLAGFPDEAWPSGALLALLNASFVRWAHFVRFRDARQPILPQVKVAHLRRVPVPARVHQDRLDALAALGSALSRANAGLGDDERRRLDEAVADFYDLDAGERAVVDRWRARLR